MEQVQKLEPVAGHVPLLKKSDLSPDGWEIVIFVYPFCHGTCAHCWSAQTSFGRPVNLDWYENFFRSIDFSKIREIRLSGGDPLLYPEIGGLIDVINRFSHEQTNITILTSGLGFISTEQMQRGVNETISNLKKIGVIKPKVAIHLSADENHAGSLFRYVNKPRKMPVSPEDIQKENLLGFNLVKRQTKNFLKAMDILSIEKEGFLGGKLKVHAGTGRLTKYRKMVFPWLNNEKWLSLVESSEGLFDSGRAASNFQNNIKITPNSQLSLFVLPGAEFYYQPISRRSQAYTFEGGSVYLDNSKNGLGAAIIGFWNLLDRNFYGGNAMEVSNMYLKK